MSNDAEHAKAPILVVSGRGEHSRFARPRLAPDWRERENRYTRRAARPPVAGRRKGDRVEDPAAPLREAWYYALASRRLKRRAMLAKTMLGEPILLLRDAAGTPFALRDLCPHRAMPLSAGRFDGREIACCYHGWRFDPLGRCVAIPALGADGGPAADRVRVRAVPADAVSRQGARTRPARRGAALCAAF